MMTSYFSFFVVIMYKNVVYDTNVCLLCHRLFFKLMMSPGTASELF